MESRLASTAPMASSCKGRRASYPHTCFTICLTCSTRPPGLFQAAETGPSTETHPPDGYPARLGTRCDVPPVRLDPPAVGTPASGAPSCIWTRLSSLSTRPRTPSQAPGFYADGDRAQDESIRILEGPPENWSRDVQAIRLDLTGRDQTERKVTNGSRSEVSILRDLAVARRRVTRPCAPPADARTKAPLAFRAQGQEGAPRPRYEPTPPWRASPPAM